MVEPTARQPQNSDVGPAFDATRRVLPTETAVEFEEIGVPRETNPHLNPPENMDNLFKFMEAKGVKIETVENFKHSPVKEGDKVRIGVFQGKKVGNDYKRIEVDLDPSKPLEVYTQVKYTFKAKDSAGATQSYEYVENVIYSHALEPEKIQLEKLDELSKYMYMQNRILGQMNKAVIEKYKGVSGDDAAAIAEKRKDLINAFARRAFASQPVEKVVGLDTSNMFAKMQARHTFTVESYAVGGSDCIEKVDVRATEILAEIGGPKGLHEGLAGKVTFGNKAIRIFEKHALFEELSRLDPEKDTDKISEIKSNPTFSGSEYTQYLEGKVASLRDTMNDARLLLSNPKEPSGVEKAIDSILSILPEKVKKVPGVKQFTEGVDQRKRDYNRYQSVIRQDKANYTLKERIKTGFKPGNGIDNVGEVSVSRYNAAREKLEKSQKKVDDLVENSVEGSKLEEAKNKLEEARQEFNQEYATFNNERKFFEAAYETVWGDKSYLSKSAETIQKQCTAFGYSLKISPEILKTEIENTSVKQEVKKNFEKFSKSAKKALIRETPETIRPKSKEVVEEARPPATESRRRTPPPVPPRPPTSPEARPPATESRRRTPPPVPPRVPTGSSEYGAIPVEKPTSPKSSSEPERRMNILKQNIERVNTKENYIAFITGLADNCTNSGYDAGEYDDIETFLKERFNIKNSREQNYLVSALLAVSTLGNAGILENEYSIFLGMKEKLLKM